MKTYKIFSLLLAAVLFLTACGTQKTPVETPDPLLKTEEMTVSFYNAGKADAILVQTDHATMVIDTGTQEDDAGFVAWLKKQGVTEIHRLYLTHYDKDHIGGAAAVLNAFSVGEVVVSIPVKESEYVTDLERALKKNGLEAVVVREWNETIIDGVTVEVIPPQEEDYGDDTSNDTSLVIRMTLGDVSFLFAGDVEKARINELLESGIDLSATVLKVPHHGKHESNSKELFEAVSPSYAVITSSDDDLEDEKTVSQLLKVGAEIFLTREGTVTMTTDGSVVRALQ